MTTLGNYELVRPIGRGTSGVVYEAIHRTLGRRVALKVLDVAGADEEATRRARTRFLREGRAAARVKHPNVVDVFDCGTQDGQAYLAMEFVEGESLARLLTREGRLSVPTAVDLALPLLSAVAELHAAGIVHRDVKPSNLLLTSLGGERDFVKVLDFGIARLARSDDGANATLTREGGILGTPAYMSPEAVLGEEVDVRADVYSLGGVLYFMLTGIAPFEARSEGSLGLMMAQVNTVPERPSTHKVKSLPAALEDVVMRCLAKSPDNRYADGAALAAALVPFAAEPPLPV